MFSRLRPAPRLKALTLPAARQQIQTTLHECDSWLDRLSTKYALPRAVLVKMLDRPGALEHEIGTWIAEKAMIRAHQLFEDGSAAPDGRDLWDRAVRGVYLRLVAAKTASDEAEKLARYKATDELLRKMKEGKDV